MRIVVVDNGSTDGSTEKLRKLVETAEHGVFIQNQSNLGFARGCNVGLQYALKNGCDYALLLNNDAEVAPGFLEAAVLAAESDPAIGLVGGKIYLPDRQRLWYAGGRINFVRGDVVIRGFRMIDQGQFDQPGETGFVTGAMMLIRRAVIEQVGLLPEEYFFGQEEWDYSVQVARAGYKLYYEPRSVAYHRSDGSHRNSEPKYVYNGYRNKLIFQQKYLPRRLWPVYLSALRMYRRVWAKRQIAGLHDKDADIDQIVFALQCAIEDHCRSPRNAVTEADLTAFSARLAAQFTPR
jgi:GT2 family glycosyltransferase